MSGFRQRLERLADRGCILLDKLPAVIAHTGVLCRGLHELSVSAVREDADRVGARWCEFLHSQVWVDLLSDQRLLEPRAEPVSSAPHPVQKARELISVFRLSLG